MCSHTTRYDVNTYSVIMLWIMMKRYSLSIRDMITELHFSRGSRKVADLKWAPSKSWLHKWMHRIPLEMLDAMILFTAEDDAYGSFSVDSSHHRFNRYRLVDNSVAADKLNRQWVGIDLSPKAVELVAIRTMKTMGIRHYEIANREDIPKRTDQGKVPLQYKQA